jgi:hypothetical protein
MACEQDTPLTIIKGADLSFTVTLTDENDEAIDLTNFTTYMEVRERRNHTSTRYLVATTAVSSPATAGVIQVTIPNTTTEDITWTKAYYDLFIISNANVRTKVLKGPVSVEESVSF